jgi:hypothetical protein
MHNYASQHGRLPPAVVYGDDGTPLLSWRVLILPHLGEQALYERFKLDEPWDSPNNLPLLAEMPVLYGPFDGSAPRQPHSTVYQVFVGKGTAFEGPHGLRLQEDFPDGTSNTVLIIEAAEGVPWTKPADLTYAADQPLPKLGGITPGVFRVALADGSVRGVTQDFDDAVLRLAITRDDGKPLPQSWNERSSRTHVVID